MYEQLLAEAIHAGRLLEAERHRLGQQALRLATSQLPPAAATAPLWQRPFSALRRAAASTSD